MKFYDSLRSRCFQDLCVCDAGVENACFACHTSRMKIFSKSCRATVTIMDSASLVFSGDGVSFPSIMKYLAPESLRFSQVYCLFGYPSLLANVN